MKPGSITKNRVSEIPYDSTSSEVIYEVVDEARQNNWEILEVKRNAGEEISRFPRHSHMWLELIIPVQGIAEVNVKNTVYFVHPGNMLIIPPLMIHESRRSDFHSGYTGFVVQYSYHHLHTMIDHASRLVFDSSPVVFEQKWLEHIKSAIALMEGNDPLNRLRISLMMDDILLEIAQRYGHWDQNGPEESQIVLVQKALCAIQENAFRNQSIQEAAAELHVSYAYLSRCFKKETGITMTEFRDEVRMAKAAKLINHSDIPLESISMEVGYGEYAPFCRKFRSYFGCTPSSLRKTGHKQSI